MTKKLFLVLLLTVLSATIKCPFYKGFHVFADSSATTFSRVFGATSFTLKNGLEVVVVPNHRAHVVTHMLWVKAGAADEPAGESGTAHYLEHLMFKGTPHQAPGAYSRRVAALGGDDNAFTSQDYTAYFATLAPEHLPELMQMERERFLYLAPPPEHARSELAVVIEERRQRTENDPLGALQEQLNATLFAGSPYADPIIGWPDDLPRLDWAAVKAFKDRWYRASNMILVLSGDITPDVARKLATQYYADWPQLPVPARPRMIPPPFPAPTALFLASPRVEQPSVMVGWRAPSFREDKAQSLALQVAAEVLDGGPSTRLYQDLVVTQKKASAISFSYTESAWGDGSIWVSATPAQGVSLATLQAAVFSSLAQATTGITDDEVARAQTRLIRQAAFARDSVAGPAMVIGQAMATGTTLEDIETWPAQIGGVTAAQVRAALTQQFLCTGPAQDTCPAPVIARVAPKAPAPAPK